MKRLASSNSKELHKSRGGMNYTVTTKIVSVTCVPCCKVCGENLEGDGYTSVMYCTNNTNEDILYMEPDAGPIYCE